MRRLLKVLIRIYQLSISPFLGPRCRFFPSCSQFAYECFEKYPVHIALYKSCRRVCCCHPFHAGGVDLP